MAATTLRRSSTGFALGLCLTVLAGCSFVRAAGRAFVEEEARDADSPTRGSPGAPELEGAGPLRRGDEASPPEDTRSTYVVSPALTWGALQLERPHALTGSPLNQSSLWGPHCQTDTRAPFEVTGEDERSYSERLAGSGPAWVGAGGSAVTLGTAMSLDRDVVTDRGLRSGAQLVRDGPRCISSFYFYTVMVGSGDGAAEHW